MHIDVHILAFTRSFLLGRTSLAALILCSAAPAWAQDTAAPTTRDPASPPQAEAASADKPESESAEIVVTGSRIRRLGYDTVQPTTVLSSATIAKRAPNSVADVLNEMPSFGIPGSTPVGNANSTGRVTTGQNFVNYYGLGSQRSLTLVNGMRFPGANTPSANGSSPGQQVDLNTIPLALIDRVETVAVGGAPIYGADAIAGTVNIILKKRFVGFDATVTSGISDQGDAARYRAQALYGVNFADNKGNIAANVEYNHQSALTQADRSITAQQLTFQAPVAGSSPFQNVVVANTRTAITNFNGIVLIKRAFPTTTGGARDAAGNLIQFSPSGNLVPYNLGTPTGSGTSYSGGDGIDLAGVTTLLGKSDRYLGNLFVNYEFTPSLRAHVEGWFSRTDAVGPANQPDFNSVFAAGAGDRDSRFNNGPYAIRLTNPYLTAQARSVLATATDLNHDGVPDNILDLNNDGVKDSQGFYIDKSNADLEGSRPSYNRQDLYRVSGSLDGDFHLGARKFAWSVSAAYGETRSSFRERATLVDRLNQAVDAVADPISGQIVCRDQSNGCAPLNVFTNSPSQAAINFVTADVTSKSRITQTLVSANLTGAVVTLPGGDASIALGADYRGETSSFTPDALSTSGPGSRFSLDRNKRRL
jgi:iron complex outermembrane receptor protein